MSFYAQTNIQLLNQLQHEGYSKQDLVSIGNTYELSMKMFTGSYRPSGKTFIAHLIGTASILTSLHVSARIVAAGLIHSIYTDGDFGTGKKGISNIKRKQIKSVVGEEVEEYVYRYAAQRWNSKNIITIRDRLDKLDQIDRDVLLIRLADQLEDSLDLGILYCSNYKSRQKFFQDVGPILLEMAHKIGFPALATELETALGTTILAEIPEELCHHNREKRSFFILPRSSRYKFSVAIYQKFIFSVNYLRSTLLHMKCKLRSFSLYNFQKFTD